MTTQEKQMMIDYLRNGEEGDFVEDGVRMVEVTNMCGGRYLDKKGIQGLTSDELLCVKFLEYDD